jgi:hypothetical protein
MTAQQRDLLTTLEPTVAKNFNRPRELLAAEMWLAQRLSTHGVKTIFSGVSDSDLRKQRFRQAIVENGFQQVMACANSSNERVACTYAEAFEEMYGEPLEPEVTKRVKRRRNTTEGGAVMNPPVSAAEGTEAGNRNMPQRHEPPPGSKRGASAGHASPRSAEIDEDEIAF